MTRVKRGVRAKYRHKKILKKSKGYYGARSRLYKVAVQSNIKAHQYSYRDRRTKKRNFRRLWIIKINAASRKFGIPYSLLIKNLKELSINLNRKVLSNISVFYKNIFKALIDKIKIKKY